MRETCEVQEDALFGQDCMCSAVDELRFRQCWVRSMDSVPDAHLSLWLAEGETGYLYITPSIVFRTPEYATSGVSVSKNSSLSAIIIRCQQ